MVSPDNPAIQSWVNFLDICAILGDRCSTLEERCYVVCVTALAPSLIGPLDLRTSLDRRVALHVGVGAADYTLLFLQGPTDPCPTISSTDGE